MSFRRSRRISNDTQQMARVDRIGAAPSWPRWAYPPNYTWTNLIGRTSRVKREELICE
jgi:hypothetical protein